MKIYRLKYQLTEEVHYFACQDVINHPIVTEAFKYGDFDGKGYDALEWDNQVYAAELVTYPSGVSEVFVGEWLMDVCDHGKGMTDYCEPCGRIHSA